MVPQDELRRLFPPILKHLRENYDHMVALCAAPSDTLQEFGLDNPFCPSTLPLPHAGVLSSWFSSSVSSDSEMEFVPPPDGLVPSIEVRLVISQAKNIALISGTERQM